jgi:hypothetical protein
MMYADTCYCKTIDNGAMASLPVVLFGRKHEHIPRRRFELTFANFTFSYGAWQPCSIASRENSRSPKKKSEISGYEASACLSRCGDVFDKHNDGYSWKIHTSS